MNFRKDMGHMNLYRVFRQHQEPSNLAIGKAEDDEANDLSFSPREAAGLAGNARHFKCAYVSLLSAARKTMRNSCQPR